MTDEELKEVIRQAAMSDLDTGRLTYGYFPQIPEENEERFYELIEQAQIAVSVTWDGDKP